MPTEIRPLISQCNADECRAALCAAWVVACADGKVAVLESDFLRLAARELGVKEDEARHIGQMARSGRLQASVPSGEPARRLLLHYALASAAADKKIAAPERNIAERLGRSLGLNPVQVASELDEFSPPNPSLEENEEEATDAAEDGAANGEVQTLLGDLGPSAALGLGGHSPAGTLFQAALIVVTNVIPLVGMFAFGWDLFPVLLLYWLETCAIGVFTLVKIMLALPGYRPVPGRSVRYWRQGKDSSQSASTTEVKRKWAIPPTFVLIYGGMMLMYGAFIISLIGGKQSAAAALESLSVFPGGVVLVVSALCVEHAVAAYFDFFGGPAWARSDPIFHFIRIFPGRFLLLHMVVILGGVATHLFSLPRLTMVLFIVLKLCGDLLSLALASAGAWRRTPPLAA